MVAFSRGHIYTRRWSFGDTGFVELGWCMVVSNEWGLQVASGSKSDYLDLGVYLHEYDSKRGTSVVKLPR